MTGKGSCPESENNSGSFAFEYFEEEKEGQGRGHEVDFEQAGETIDFHLDGGE